jgi:membrane protease YdiL (CAAX protease family)
MYMNETPEPTVGATTGGVENERGAPARRDRRPLLAVLVAVGLVVAGLVGNLLVSVAAVLGLLAVGVAVDTTVGFAATLVAGQVAFLAVGWLYVTRRLGPLPVRRPTGAELRLAAGATVLALVLVTTLSAVASALVPGETTTAIGEAVTVDPVLALALAALSVLVVAPAEELLFRGAVQGRLRRSLGAVPAVVVASGLFAAVHVFGFLALGAATVAALATLFAVALVFGVVYERTGNLVVPTLVHGLYNATLLVVSYVALVLA